MIIHSNTKVAQLNSKKKEEIKEIKTEKVARKNKVKKDFIAEEVIPSSREED